MSCQIISQIPVVDFSDEYLKPGTETWVSASQVLRSALETDGCFFIKCSEVHMELYNSVFALSKEMFELPLDTKKQKVSDKPAHGYLGSPKIPLYESLGIDLDGPTIEEALHKFTKLMWPAGYDHFCETINRYAKLVVEMDQTTKRLLFDAYGLDKKSCDSLIESTNYLFRGFKYLVPQGRQSNIGLVAHTDSSYFTILHQNDVAGLEVKLKTGEWVTIDPSPSLFLVVGGDVIKVWSNDRIPACEHQVIMRADKERYSIGISSFNGKIVQTQEELIDEDHPRRYKAFDNYEYIALHGKVSRNDLPNHIKL